VIVVRRFEGGKCLIAWLVEVIWMPWRFNQAPESKLWHLLRTGKLFCYGYNNGKHYIASRVLLSRISRDDIIQDVLVHAALNRMI
jgi:hypothetical protein